MPESLWLKSAESSSSNVDSKQPSPSAVLCTDNHTFELRQVQSSNSVFILQPSENRHGDNKIPSPSLSAIAQCTSTLELVPSDIAASCAMISRLLRTSLPPYKGPDTDIRLERTTMASSKREAPRDQKVWTVHIDFMPRELQGQECHTAGYSLFDRRIQRDMEAIMCL